jgi:hypothetical protein
MGGALQLFENVSFGRPRVSATVLSKPLDEVELKKENTLGT